MWLWRCKCAAGLDLERDFQGGAEGVVRDVQWRSDEVGGQGSTVGHLLQGCGRAREGFHCRGLSVYVGMERGKRSNSRLWVWVEEASVQGCGYGQWVRGGGVESQGSVHLRYGNADWCGHA